MLGKIADNRNSAVASEVEDAGGFRQRFDEPAVPALIIPAAATAIREDRRQTGRSPLTVTRVPDRVCGQ
jgi:hypothetical protein